MRYLRSLATLSVISILMFSSNAMAAGKGNTKDPVPSVPSGLTAELSYPTVILSWLPNPETFVVGYNIYRSTKRGTGYIKLNASLISATYFKDSGMRDGTYYYEITAVSDAKVEGRACAPVAVAFLDNVPPTIHNVSSNTTIFSSSIYWMTDEPADSQVEYGSTTSYGLSSPLNASMVSSHQVDIASLIPNTLYHYRVRSSDAAGNLTISGDYTFTTQPPVVAAPMFSPSPRLILTAQEVTISTVTPGATIRYTTDGSTPTETIGIVYSAPVPVSAAITIRAIAYQTGWTSSSVSTGVYRMMDKIPLGAGFFHSVALGSDGTVWAWGENNYGQLGDGTWTRRLTPVQVVSLDGFSVLTGVVAVAAGAQHSIALKSDGTVWAWGVNGAGELGDGTTTIRMNPVQVVSSDGLSFLSEVVAIEAGWGFTLALRSDGTVWAWGYNGSGQLGDGTTVTSIIPVQVLSPDGVSVLSDVVAIRAGYDHSVAVKSDGTVWAWGYNNWGQLGDGTQVNRNLPVQVISPDGVSMLTNVIAVAAGDVHSVALKGDGTVWAWGYNGSGQLGDGTMTTSLTPVQVVSTDGLSTLSGVIAVAAGGWHSFSVKSDGTVWGWGMNGQGQLGDGTTYHRLTPAQVVSPDGLSIFNNAVAIEGGDLHTLAQKSDGTVWAWGGNYFGQLGNGTYDWSLTPCQVIW